MLRVLLVALIFSCGLIAPLHKTAQFQTDSQVAESVERLMVLCVKKGWRISSIQVKHPSEAPDDVGLMANNGDDILYAGSGFEKWYTSSEVDFMVSHEMAHMVLRNHRWLNPHWYMDLYTHPLTVAVGVYLAQGFLRVKGTAPRRFLGALGIGYLSSVYKEYDAYSLDHRGKKRYACASKPEEFLCDLIAASLVGTEAGLSYLDKTQRIFGNSSSLTHPSPSTRAQVLGLLSWFDADGIASRI